MLSIVSVPIGNLGDITTRAREVLTACDAVVCEDTRVTGKLLSLLQLPKKDLIALHSYANDARLEAAMRRLKKGDHLALVSDAGTPGISDPGYAIVSRARAEGIDVQVVPGPAAFLAALSASGLPINRFTYLGFLPIKKGRKTLLATLADEPHTVVFYESVHRIERTLVELADALAAQPERAVVVARELTKMHEEVTRTTVSELGALAATITKKGEFAVVIGPR